MKKNSLESLYIDNSTQLSTFITTIYFTKSTLLLPYE